MLKTYIIHGRSEGIGPCNIIDKWNGQFKYDEIILLPCGCEIYVGDLQISQDNNWPHLIDIDDDFSFRLVCVCGVEATRCASAKKNQELLGWAYMF